MKKGLYYKILSTFILISLLLLNIAPFSLKADYFGTAPYVGINYWIEDYDNEYNMTISSGTGTLTADKTTGSAISLGPGTLSNGQTFYSTGLNGGGVSIKGNITLNQSSSSVQVVRRVIHCDIVLDNNYIGYVKIRVHYNNVDYFNQELSVNGNIVSFQFVDTNSSTYSVAYNMSLNEQMIILNEQGERYNFPLESFNIVNQSFSNNYKVQSYFNNNTYIWPVFKVPNGSKLGELWTANGNEYYFIFGTNYNINISNWSNNFIAENCQVISIDELFFSPNMIIKRWKLKSTKSGFIRLYPKQDTYFMPVYLASEGNRALSTDFALNFSLTNDLLNNLNIIANGNTSSNQSSSNANSTNQSLNQEGQKVEQLEQQLVSDFDSSMNNISVDSPLNILGSGFVQSANWVRTQFDTLTTNTPFGTLITFSLILGIGLLIIGKVFG